MFSKGTGDGLVSLLVACFSLKGRVGIVVHCLEVIKHRNEEAVHRATLEWLQNPQEVLLGDGKYALGVTRIRRGNVATYEYGIGMVYNGVVRAAGDLLPGVGNNYTPHPCDMFVVCQNVESAMMLASVAKQVVEAFGGEVEADKHPAAVALRTFAREVADALFAAGHRTDGPGPLCELRKVALELAKVS